MEPAELVAALRSAGAGDEDTDDADGSLRDSDGTRSGSGRFARPRRTTGSCDQRPHRRLPGHAAARRPGTQEERLRALRRAATAYLEAGVDCVYPIVLWEPGALQERFMAEVRGRCGSPVACRTPSLAELAALGGQGELGTLPLPRRDDALRGPARLASETRVTTGDAPTC